MKDREATAPRSMWEDRTFADLDARLRVLRERHSTLSVLTEVVHLSERLVAIRAIVSIDGLVRAHGHAATAADRSGAFVAEAELLAVRQALLLGGLLSDAAAPPAHEDDPASATTNAIGQGEAPLLPASLAPEVDPLPRPQRQRVSDAARRPAASQSASPAAAVPSAPPSDPVLSNAPTEGVAAVATEPAAPPSVATTVDSAAVAAPPPPQAATAQPAPQPAPRPKRERVRSRAAAAAPASAATAEADAAEMPQEASAPAAEAAAPSIETDVLTTPEAPTAVQGQLVDVVPKSVVGPPAPRPASPPRRPADAAAPSASSAPIVARPTATRRPRAIASPAAPATPAPAAPPTREQLRAAWTRGRPIPAWWPPERPLMPKRVTKAQTERLRVVALDEEITPALLDTYSTMLFARPVAELDQTEYAILEERLDRTYPSPLEETRARRLLFPIAVADAMPIPPDHPVFIRWGDVPPVVEEEPRAPAVPSWRTRGTRAGGRRR